MRTKLPIYVQKKSLPVPGVDYELDLPRQHLSYSQISLYLKCPAQYYHRYVLGMESPRSVHLFEGSCMNHVMETMGRRWVKRKKHLNLLDAVGEYRKYFEKNEGNVEQWHDVDPNEVRERANVFLKIFFSDSKLLNLIQPTTIGGKLGVEFHWRKDFNGVPVVGITDLLTKNHVWDYKCVGKKPDVDQSLQLSFYSVAHDTPDVGLIAFMKKRIPTVEILRSVRRPRKTKQWLDTVVSRVAFGISNKIWTPCEGELSWWCDPKWCFAWKECRGF